MNQPQKELKRQWTVRPSGCQGMWRIPHQIIVRLSGIGLPHRHQTVQRRFQECSAAHPGIASAHSPAHQAIAFQPVHTCGFRTRCNCVIAIHAPYGGCKSLFLQDMQTDSWKQFFADSLLRSPEAFAATDLLHQLTRAPSILHPDPKFQVHKILPTKHVLSGKVRVLEALPFRCRYRLTQENLALSTGARPLTPVKIPTGHILMAGPGSGVGRACSAPYVVSVALCGAAVSNMSDHGRFGGPRFAQLDGDYKVWAAYHRAQLRQEKLWAAVVTDLPASASDDKKSDPVVEARDAMLESSLATIRVSDKPVHLNRVTSVDTAKKARDALKVMFEARDHAQLLRLMDELSSRKAFSDENSIKLTSRAKMIRDELCTLSNPVDDNTLALRVLSELSELPQEYGMLRTVFEEKDIKLVLLDVTAKLLQVEQRNITGGSSKPAGALKSQAFAAAAPKKTFEKKSVLCFHCNNKGHMQRGCYKKKADKAKEKGKTGGGGPDSGRGSGPQANAALAYTAFTGNAGSRKVLGSTCGLATWVLDSGATNHLAAGVQGFALRTAGSGTGVTLANGDKVPIKGHGHVSMDVGKGSTKTRVVCGEAVLASGMTGNLLSGGTVARNRGAVVFVDNAWYLLSDGDALRLSGVLDKASVVGRGNDLEQYVLKVTPSQASANAASTRIAGKAQLWHRRFNHLGMESLTLAATMVYGIPSSVADAKRVIGTACMPCVDGKMVQAPSPRSSTAPTKCELVHTDVGGPFTKSLGGSIYFMAALEDSTGFTTATPIKTKWMAPDVLKTRMKQLERLTGVKVQRVRHEGAKE